MVRALLILVLLFNLAFLVSAQDKKPCSIDTRNVLISQDNPSVYITFERRAEQPPRHKGESGDYIWLRLHNNTHWTITTFAGSSLPVDEKSLKSVFRCGMKQLILRDGTEIDGDYYVEASPGSGIDAPKILRHDILAAEVWIEPGKTFLFRVPREHLTSGLDIYVPFSYDWEDYIRENRHIDKLTDLPKYEEPRHFVYFRSYQLN